MIIEKRVLIYFEIYFGCWNAIDESAFEELTENLILNRNKNARRFIT